MTEGVVAGELGNGFPSAGSAFMRSSSRKDLSVYDFDAEDFGVEAASTKFLKMSGNPRENNKEKKEERLTNYDSFKTLSGHKQVDAIDMSCIYLIENSSSKGSLLKASPDRNFSSEEKPGLDEIMASSTSYDEKGNLCLGEFDHETLTRVDPLVIGVSGHVSVTPSVDNKHESELHSDGSPVDVISDDEGNYTSANKSPSTSASDLDVDEDYLECPVSDNCSAESGEEDDDEMEVIVYPDYVFYGDTLYHEVCLTFTPDSLMVERLDSCRNSESSLLKCAVADIIYIECQLIGSVEAPLVKFLVRATTVNGNDKVFDTFDAGELEFVISEMHWSHKEHKIKSLSASYKDAWNVLQHDDLTVEYGAVQRDKFFPKHYFIEIPESFEDVIYPKGDPDAVSISRRDIELLQPDTFVNDTIIDFYIKYLKGRIPPNEKHRYHFFNSFFFRKLADLDKDPESVSEGRAAFLRVRKWTRKLDIFEKDYIFIPVNFNLHWSLLVICHPGEASSYEEDNVRDSAKVPCLLHMDSIKGSHSGLKNLVQSYLWEEWKERHPEEPEEKSSKFSNLRYVSLELPQQENSSDCGLFLLHYVELFLLDAPVHFNPFEITSFSNFLSVDWFSPSEASFKRCVIRKLIYDILNDPSQKVNPNTFCGGNLTLGRYQNIIDQEPAVSYLSEQYNTSKTLVGDPVCFVTEGGTQTIHFPSSSSLNISQCDKQEGLLLGEFLATKAISMSSIKLQDHTLQDNKFSEIVKYPTFPTKDERFVSVDEDKFCTGPSGGSPTTQNCSTSYYTKTDGAFEMPLNSVNEKDVGTDCLPEALDGDHLVSSHRVGTEKPGSVLMEDSGYVPDSPTSSSCENHENGSLEDSTGRKEGSSYGENSFQIEVTIGCQEINTTKSKFDSDEDLQETSFSKAEEENIIGRSQRFEDTVEAKNDHDEECHEVITSEAKVGSSEGSRQIDSGKAEKSRVVENSHMTEGMIEADTGNDVEYPVILKTEDKVGFDEKCQKVEISEANSMKSEDYQVIGPSTIDVVDNEDCKLIDTMEMEDVDDINIQQIYSNSATEKECSCEESPRLASSHDILTASGESSGKVGEKRNRDKTAFMESLLHYHKRPKILPPGVRKHTRSQTRDMPS